MCDNTLGCAFRISARMLASKNYHLGFQRIRSPRISWPGFHLSSLVPLNRRFLRWKPWYYRTWLADDTQILTLQILCTHACSRAHGTRLPFCPYFSSCDQRQIESDRCTMFMMGGLDGYVLIEDRHIHTCIKLPLFFVSKSDPLYSIFSNQSTSSTLFDSRLPRIIK
jgi:hypothetical protein